MNLVDAVVTKLITHIPFYDYGWWWVKVEYESYGISDKTTLMFKTENEAKKVNVGYKFLT